MNPVAQLPRPPARASEIEALLFGALLEATDPGALIDLSGLAPTDLQDPRVRIGWDLVARLVKRRRPVDAVSVFAAGKAVGVFHEGDLNWLRGLQSANQITALSFGGVAENLRRLTRGRVIAHRLREEAASIESRGLQPAELSGTLEGITLQLARDYVANSTAEGAVAEIVDAWYRPKGEGGLLFVPTGIRVLDEQIQGFVPGLNMILGDPQVGKSSVAGTCIEAQAAAGYKPGLFGLEEGHRWLAKRLLARDLELKIGDVGREIPVSGSRIEEGIQAHAPRITTTLSNVQVYSQDGAGIDEIIRRATDWILNYGVQIIWIDHIGEIRHRASGGGGADGFNWAVAETYRRLRDLGNKRGVPIVALAHRKPDARDRKGPPRPNDVGLTGEAEKMVRRMIALWREGPALRAAAIKNNEGPTLSDTGMAVEFERHVTAGLVAADGGKVVSLEAEAREKAKEKAIKAQEQKDAESFRVRTRNKELAAKDKAAKVAEAPRAEPAPAPQLDLLGGPKP